MIVEFIYLFEDFLNYCEKYQLVYISEMDEIYKMKSVYN